jgi:histone deacetylase complex regulatory component SIN3
VSEDEIGIDTHHSIEDIYTDPRDNSPPSYEFE